MRPKALLSRSESFLCSFKLFASDFQIAKMRTKELFLKKFNPGLEAQGWASELSHITFWPMSALGGLGQLLKGQIILKALS